MLMVLKCSNLTTWVNTSPLKIHTQIITHGVNMKLLEKWRKIFYQYQTSTCNRNYQIKQELQIMNFQMAHRYQWAVLRDKILEKSFSWINHLLQIKINKSMRTSNNKTYLDSQEFSKWLLSQYPNQTSISEETCSQTLSPLEEPRCSKDFKSVFKNNFLKFHHKMWKLKS